MPGERRQKLKKNHNYANHQKNVHAIWKIKNVAGEEVKKLKDIAKPAVEHFDSLFKGEERVTIPKVVKIYQFFPTFVNKKDNQVIMEEVTKDAV